MASRNLRREIKFVLREADVPALRCILDANCRRVRYGGDTSRVVSLYFDDARLSACHDNIEGAPRRSKVRLRWYDAALPGGRAFLELKWRDGQATGKERQELALDEGLGASPFHALARELERRTSGPFREAVAARQDAVVVIEYERTYYEAADAPFPVRITLDSDLVFYRQLGSRFVRRRFPARAKGLVIVEGKTPVGEEHRLGALLSPLSPRVSRSSKYVMACQAVGLLRGSGYSS